MQKPTVPGRLGAISLSLSLILLLLGGCGKTQPDTANTKAALAPVAKVVPKAFEEHGNTRIDNYYWLKERESPEVIKYLEDENAYTQTMLGHTDKLQEELFQEMRSRIKEDDNSVPFLQNGYYYYTRFETGKEYPIYCRKQGSLEAAEQILLDGNQMASGHEYFAIGATEVSTNANLLAYAVDVVGRRIYSIQIKDLTTGQLLADTIEGATNNIEWAGDNQTLFYTRQDQQTLRWDKIYRHRLGTPVADDVLVYQENDDTFNCYVYKTKSDKFLIIGSDSTLTTESRFLDAANPEGSFQIVQQRIRGLEYDISHRGDKFYIRANDDARNFRLVEAPVANPGKENWLEVIPHREDVLLSQVEIFQNFLVLGERKSGLTQIEIIPFDTMQAQQLNFDEAAYTASISTNRQFDSKLLRFNYSSLTTPNSVFDYDMVSGEKTLLKQDEVLGGFNVADYQSERLFAKAADGVEIPISVVYRKGIKRDGSNPLLQYGYGSYGNSMNPRFDSNLVSLLDRGFIYALVHIRGGSEMGRFWYEDGKLFKKKNTFTDFIACSEFLIAEKFTSANRLFAYGGSAGGLLMGAVVNMRPDLYRGVAAAVPFVDVITTMLDPSIPLTTGEYDEWGDPNQKDYYDYIHSYSPYDNVTAQAYPNLLVTTGLHDSQVQYWEPAKWVAKLRATKTDQNLLLLKTNMDAGHGGASGRFARLKERALVFAFFISLVEPQNQP